MKYSVLLLLAVFFNFQNSEELKGSWESNVDGVTTLVLIQDGYISITEFEKDSFKNTRGGFMTVKENILLIEQEFNTAHQKLEKEILVLNLKDNKLIIDQKEFTRTGKKEQALSGVWKITGRLIDGEMKDIQQRGTRKTLKMISGNRFHWFAIDPDGNKFYGSGGGTYTFENGKYVEQIQFFSRDNSRVGASLSFDDHLDNGKWHHTGLSSKGDEIYEIWEKVFKN